MLCDVFVLCGVQRCHALVEVQETEACNHPAAAAPADVAVAEVESSVEGGEEKMAVVMDVEPAVATVSEEQPKADEEAEEDEEEDMYVGASLRALFNMLPSNGSQGQDSATAVEGDDSQWLQDEVTNRPFILSQNPSQRSHNAFFVLPHPQIVSTLNLISLSLTGAGVSLC